MAAEYISICFGLLAAGHVASCAGGTTGQSAVCGAPGLRRCAAATLLRGKPAAGKRVGAQTVEPDCIPVTETERKIDQWCFVHRDAMRRTVRQAAGSPPSAIHRRRRSGAGITFV